MSQSATQITLIANRVAKWNGSSWSALGSGMDGRCLALAVSGSDLYAGGYFTTAGGSAANHIAKWNGSSWSALGSGMNNQCLCAGGVGHGPLKPRPGAAHSRPEVGTARPPRPITTARASFNFASFGTVMKDAPGSSHKSSYM